MDVVAVEKMIQFLNLDEQQTIQIDQKAKNSLALMQTFVLRGLCTMLRVLKTEYVRFL